jgi:hypothetical protein
MVDFIFQNHGTLWLCIPQNKTAEKHLFLHVDQETQRWAGGVVVEPRYVAGLVQGLEQNGFSVEG